MITHREIESAELDQYIRAHHPEANFLQSSAWGEAQKLRGAQVIRLGFFDDEQPVGATQIIIRSSRRGNHLEIAGGPLIDWNDQSLTEYVIKTIRSLAKKHHCVYARIRPQVFESSGMMERLKKLGLKRASYHLHAEHTILLGLAPTEDELLANMRRQTRYEIRRAAKIPEIEVSYSTDPSLIETFYEMQQSTAERQDFHAPDLKELEAIHQALDEIDGVRIYYATVDGNILSMALILKFGEEIDYLEAASFPEARKYPLAYAIQWRIIRDAKNNGLKRYNMWGIAYSDNPNHRFAHVTTFKKGFGGEPVAYTPAHDLIIDRLRYTPIRLIELARKKRRKL